MQSSVQEHLCSKRIIRNDEKKPAASQELVAADSSCTTCLRQFGQGGFSPHVGDTPLVNSLLQSASDLSGKASSPSHLEGKASQCTFAIRCLLQCSLILAPKLHHLEPDVKNKG